MGWLFSSHWDTKAAMVQHLKAQLQQDGKVVAAKSTKSGLWAVVERDAKRFIFLALIERGGGVNGYGYKDMDEAMGPYYFDCPLEFLDMAPVANVQWREGVVAHHARKAAARSLKAALKPGVTLKLQGKTIPQVVVVEVDGRRITGQYGGRYYRISTSTLVGATVVE